MAPKLRLILCEIENYVVPNIPTITCLFRSSEEQLTLFEQGLVQDKSSVHIFGRGADLRLFDPATNEGLIFYLNKKYPYDYKRPALKTIQQHKGTAEHLHVQVL